MKLHELLANRLLHLQLLRRRTRYELMETEHDLQRFEGFALLIYMFGASMLQFQKTETQNLFIQFFQCQRVRGVYKVLL